MKKYYLFETTKIAEYEDEKEAIADKDNRELWYPENSYEVLTQEKYEN